MTDCANEKYKSVYVIVHGNRLCFVFLNYTCSSAITSIVYSLFFSILNNSKFVKYICPHMSFTPWISYYRNIPPCSHHYEALSHNTTPFTSLINSDSKYSSLLTEYIIRNVKDQGINIPRKEGKYLTSESP